MLKISGLSAILPDGREILSDINLDLGRGETVALLGPNGAGKSTLASVIAGHPSFRATGHLEYQGQDLLSLPPYKRAQMGIFTTFQAPVEVPGVSTTEVLRTAIKEREQDYVPLDRIRADITTAAKALGTDIWFAEREMNVGFSGGERKKNEILQLLTLRPQLAILDEIDSGLDIDAIHRTSVALRQYQAETGCTYLIISHNMRLFRELRPSRAVLLSSGRIAAVGGEELVTAVEKHGFAAVLRDFASERPSEGGSVPTARRRPARGGSR